MRTALLYLPSQSLTSVLEPRFRCLGRKLILRIAFGKVGGSPPVVAAPSKRHHLSVVPLLGAVTGGAKPTEVKVLFITATPL